ncbi:MAG: gluconate permease, partial [Planctomycetota bacterium]
TTAGFVLSIPVFFDTVVYLVAPLARATHRAMGDRGYLKYLMAVGAGGATAHSLVLPTPGPLVIAGILGVSVGTMLLVGLAVAVPTAVVGGIAAVWFADRMGERQPPSVGEVTADEEARAAAPGDVMEQAQEPTATNDPGLALALLPVVLPVLLISSNTAIGAAFPGESNAVLANVKSVAAVVGDPSVALTLAAAASVFVLCRQTGRSLRDLVTFFESAVTDAGPIILITSAGGSFGAMLKLAELKIAVSNMTGGAELAGLGALVLAFIVTIIVKVAQGSSTAAMTIAGGIVAGLLVSDVPPGELASALAAACGFHPVYLAVAIGSGAIVGAWMNDSGFWIFTKFAGLSPVEGLKTWTPLMSILGVTAFLTTLLLASVFPMAG